MIQKQRTLKADEMIKKYKKELLDRAATTPKSILYEVKTKEKDYMNKN